jgi:general secretion pathway protein D
MSTFVLLLVAGGLALASCAQLTNGTLTSSKVETKPTDIDVLDKVRSIDLSPRFPQQTADGEARTDERHPAIYNGAAEVPAVGDPSTPSQASGGEGYDLNFDNVPIANVAKVVLGDILHVGYTIDPRVQGTVTLASGRPVPKSDILFVLETALRTSNVVLVRDQAGYHLSPLGDAVGSGPVDRSARAEPGYGITVVPLRYVSAQTLLKLLDSFALKAGSVRADTGRNMLIIQGSGAERSTAVETVESFDVDWMRGQSVGIYPVHNGTPEPLIAELEKIMDSGEGGLGQNMVKLQAMGRQNAVLAVARKPDYLRIVSTWITRLDNADARSSGVHVYHVRYGDARQLARVLNDVFSGGSSGGTDSPTNQIAPGSGFATTSSNDRSAFGDQPSQSSSGVRQQLGVPPPDSRGAQANAATGRNAADNVGAPGEGQVMLPGVRITADAVHNAVLVYANQDKYRIVERTLRQLDRPQLQVAIDATVAEVTLNNTLNYGVQFFLNSQSIGYKADQGSVLNGNTTAAPSVANGVTSAFLNRAFPGFNLLIGPEAQPNMILDALHEVTDVKVLSNPSVVVIDNQPATLQVGDQIPVSTGSANVLTTSNTIVNTIDYRDTGIILRVVPQVNENGNVRLDIEQEISNVSNTTSTSLTPTVSERKIKSSIQVADGQTVLLAGLITENQQRDRPGIPGLDQIPVVGDALSHSNNTTSRTELIVFIRPQIIRDSIDAHFVAEELRTKLRGALDEANVPPMAH